MRMPNADDGFDDDGICGFDRLLICLDICSGWLVGWQTGLDSWMLVSHMRVVSVNAHLNSKCICCVYTHTRTSTCVYANTSKYQADGPLAREWEWEWMWSIHKQLHPKLYLAFALFLSLSPTRSFAPFHLCADFAQPINTNDISNGNSCNKCRRKNVA